MSSALAAQLAQLRKQNANPLDLKAQTKAHSQSILFDAPHAATQDFDSIYSFCLDGFEELCRLDRDFLLFGESIFSEQSRRQDRSLMNKAQVDDLDAILADFLCLVSGVIPLKPALKAIEWIIRRFRVHENNTSLLLLSFLPHHSDPVFLNVLSILPSKVPLCFRFLAPYIKTSTNPPKRAVVFSASNSQPFLSALSAFVLDTYHKGYHSPSLVTFWASITTEAIVSMADQVKSARQEAQRENHEALLRFILPILNDALSIQNAPKLRIGSYMILTTVASKIELSDEVLKVFMVAVVTQWVSTSHAGLICLAILAEKLRIIDLPSVTLQAVLAIPGLDDEIRGLQKQYSVDKFLVGIMLGILEDARKMRRIADLRYVHTLLMNGSLSRISLSLVVRMMIDITSATRKENDSDILLQDALADSLLGLADSERVGSDVRAIVEGLPRTSMASLPARLQGLVPTPKSSKQSELSTVNAAHAVTTSVETLDFSELTKRIDDRLAYDFSFLSHENSYIYSTLAQVFSAVHHSPENLEKFKDLSVLRRGLSMTDPLFFSFYIRTWSSNQTALTRVSALRVISEYLRNEEASRDVQILLPYTLHALADPDRRVREAATELVRILSNVYAKSSKLHLVPSHQRVLGFDQIYGQSEKSTSLEWLSLEHASVFVNTILVPGLEECILDEHYISYMIKANLDSTSRQKNPITSSDHVKTSTRTSIFSFLCSHVVNSPLHAMRFRLLRILNKIERVGSVSRTKLLLPLLKELCNDQSISVASCEGEGVNFHDVAQAAVSTVTSSEHDGILYLTELLLVEGQQINSDLQEAASERLKTLWPEMKLDMQDLIALTLFRAFSGPEQKNARPLELLQSLELSTTTLHSLLKETNMSTLTFDHNYSHSKRRRTTHGKVDTLSHFDDPSHEAIIQKGSIALELIENSSPERHAQLLLPLFDILSDLSSLSNSAKSSIRYLQALSMDNVLAIVRENTLSPDSLGQRFDVRADVLVDYVRTSRDPQVRNKALLVLASLAEIAPELVLHNVMPIFTYLGTNLLPQEDDHSIHVIQQTMESIVSRLVNMLKQNPKKADSGICELIVNFAATFEDIPLHRRLDIFETLVNKVGPLEHLSTLLVILLDKYPLNKRVTQFCVQLCNRFDVLTLLTMVDEYLQVAQDSWQSEYSPRAKTLFTDRSQDGRDVTSKLLPLVPGVLRSEVVRRKLSQTLKKSAEDRSNIQNGCAKIFENLQALLLLCKDEPQLQLLIMNALDSLLCLSPTADLVYALTNLYERANNALQQQILLSLERFLSTEQGPDQLDTRHKCLAFVPRLLNTLEGSQDSALRKLAIRSLDRITIKYGKTDVLSILDAGKIMTGRISPKISDLGLQTAMLLFYATMVEVCGDVLTPIVPDIFSAAIKNLDISIAEDTEDPNLHNAAISLLSSMILHIKWAISGPNLDRVMRTSHESANAEMGAKCDRLRTEMLNSIPAKGNAKDCLLALNRTWMSAMTEGPKAVREHFDFLRIAVLEHRKSKMSEIVGLVGTMFLSAFDLRRFQLSPRTEESYDAEEIEEAEDAVNESAMAVIHKLNDASFRPLFLQFMEFAVEYRESVEGRILRLETLYSFLFNFFSTLQSIVTPYAALIIESAVQVLESQEPRNDAYNALWRKVVLTLHETFKHDQDDFYQNASHSEPVSTALISQLGLAVSDDAHNDSDNRHSSATGSATKRSTSTIPLQTIDQILIPAITELAVASESAAQQHKAINTAILQHLRSDVAAVRLAAVRCQRSLTERLGEEWLTLLPEMLQVINELQEDDDEMVERETLAWIRKIEDVMGESIEPMLQ